ncbi:hypothetical protein IQ225_09195 [Synechocystis salina LEGE 06155]|nr:hypothetical protein [Synechocystis salina LEGE 06155]
MSKKTRILQLLSDHEPHSPHELISITHRFSATIHSLREEGYNIQTIRITHNDCRYQLL